VVLRQRVQCRANGLGVGLGQMGRGLALRLGLDVGFELRGAVVDAQRTLRLRAWRRNEARGQGGGAGRESVAFEHHRLNAGALQGQRGREAAGPGPHNGHRDCAAGLQGIGRQHLHG